MVTAIVILMKLLPVIASFFEITVDDLLDAEVTLDKQEIRIVYAHFAERFSKESFETVFNDVKTKIKLEYDEENFLLQMGILLLNDAEFSKDANEVFAFVIQTLEWIEDLTTDVWIRRQVEYDYFIDSFIYAVTGHCVGKINRQCASLSRGGNGLGTST